MTARRGPPRSRAWPVYAGALVSFAAAAWRWRAGSGARGNGLVADWL